MLAPLGLLMLAVSGPQLTMGVASNKRSSSVCASTHSLGAQGQASPALRPW